MHVTCFHTDHPAKKAKGNFWDSTIFPGMWLNSRHGSIAPRCENTSLEPNLRHFEKETSIERDYDGSPSNSCLFQENIFQIFEVSLEASAMNTHEGCSLLEKQEKTKT
jgi:hypothetical protein